MSNGKMIVTKEAWERLESGDREWLMFDTLQSLDQRITTLESKSVFDRTCSFLGGVLGGVASVFGIKVLGH
jgi:hypothetical protein